MFYRFCNLLYACRLFRLCNLGLHLRTLPPWYISLFHLRQRYLACTPSQCLVLILQFIVSFVLYCRKYHRFRSNVHGLKVVVTSTIFWRVVHCSVICLKQIVAILLFSGYLRLVLPSLVRLKLLLRLFLLTFLHFSTGNHLVLLYFRLKCYNVTSSWIILLLHVWMVLLQNRKLLRSWGTCRCRLIRVRLDYQCR